MNSLWELYKTIWDWSYEIPNVRVISLAVSDYGILICFTWNSDIQYSLMFTVDTLRLADFDLKQSMLDEVERQYKLWEVGEE